MFLSRINRHWQKTLEEVDFESFIVTNEDAILVGWVDPPSLLFTENGRTESILLSDDEFAFISSFPFLESLSPNLIDTILSYIRIYFPALASPKVEQKYTSMSHAIIDTHEKFERLQEFWDLLPLEGTRKNVSSARMVTVRDVQILFQSPDLYCLQQDSKNSEIADLLEDFLEIKLRSLDPHAVRWGRSYQFPFEFKLSVPNWSLAWVIDSFPEIRATYPEFRLPLEIKTWGLEQEWSLTKKGEVISARDALPIDDYVIGLDGNEDIGELRTFPSSSLENQIQQLISAQNQLREILDTEFEIHFSPCLDSFDVETPCGLHVHVGTNRKIKDREIRKMRDIIWDTLSPVLDIIDLDPRIVERRRYGYGTKGDSIRKSDLHKGFEFRLFPTNFGTPEGIKLIADFLEKIIKVIQEEEQEEIDITGLEVFAKTKIKEANDEYLE